MLIWLAFWLQSGAGVEIVVSPQGLDSNPGTREAPLATPARARDLARERRGKGPVVILLRGGTYALAEPLRFLPEDSGSEGAPLTVAAFPGERPVLSAGTAVGGWKVEEVRGMKLWTAPLAGAPRQLWVNGVRAERPRLPKQGTFRIESLPDLKKDTPWNGGQTRFKYAEGDLKAWHNLQDVEVVALHFWVDSRMPVQELDEASRIVTLGRRSIFRLTTDHGKTPACYWVENVFEALDGPGQWYHDRKAGRIYYHPRPGEDPATSEAVVSRLLQAVSIEGRPAEKAFVEHLNFRGITLSHGEASSPPAGWPDSTVAGPYQAAFTSPGLFRAAGYRHGAFEDGQVCRTGSYGLEFGAGCSDILVSRNEIFDLGAGGLKIGETKFAAEEPLRTGRFTVADNRIHHGGRIFPSAVGVFVGHSGGNRFAHNEISELYYSGFSIGWSWGYKPAGTHDNIVEFNHVHDLGKGLLSDMGGIYTLGVSPGTIIRNNVFHDIESQTYGGWGIYFDEGTTGVLAENNIAYRCKSNGFHQHYGKENTVRNNIFALNRDAQIARSRKEPHFTLAFERNIVYWKEGKLLSGNWDGGQFRWEKNLFWNAAGPTQGLPEDWKAKGLDKDSLIADPLFVDPGKGDFRLKPGSPALALGFQPIDVSGVGPRPR